MSILTSIYSTTFYFQSFISFYYINSLQNIGNYSFNLNLIKIELKNLNGFIVDVLIEVVVDRS